MHARLAGMTLSIVIAASAAACGGSAPSPNPSPSAATSFDEYATAFCSAWGRRRDPVPPVLRGEVSGSAHQPVVADASEPGGRSAPGGS